MAACQDPGLGSGRWALKSSESTQNVGDENGKRDSEM